MRAAVLVNFVPPQRVSFYEALAKRCEEVRFFLSTKMEQNRHWTANTARLDVLIQQTLTLRRPWKHPSGFGGDTYTHIPYRTMDDLKRFSPDVVISAELGARTALAASYCRVYDTPLVIWADMSESTEAGRGALRWAVRWALLRSKSAIAVNGHSGARYLRRFGVQEQRVVVVVPPLQTPYENLQTRPRPSDGWRRILYSGRLLGIKGLVGFLSTLARCAAARPSALIQMTFAGGGPEYDALRKVKVPSNLRTIFEGELSYEQMPSVYAAHDVLVLPTYGDTWGQVVVEGMACGLPVLGSRRSQAVEELVEEDVTGWIFDPESEQEMESAIGRALDAGTCQLGMMGASAQQRVRELTPARSTTALIHAMEIAMELRGKKGVGLTEPPRLIA